VANQSAPIHVTPQANTHSLPTRFQEATPRKLSGQPLPTTTEIGFHFFSALEVWGFFLQSLISQTVLCVPLTVKWNRKWMLSQSSHNKCYRYPQRTELCGFEMVYDITLIYQQPKPSHGTTSAPAKRQVLKTKMDIWRDTLRKRHWMPPRPPPTGTVH